MNLATYVEDNNFRQIPNHVQIVRELLLTHISILVGNHNEHDYFMMARIMENGERHIQFDNSDMFIDIDRRQLSNGLWDEEDEEGFGNTIQFRDIELIMTTTKINLLKAVENIQKKIKLFQKEEHNILEQINFLDKEEKDSCSKKEWNEHLVNAIIGEDSF